MTAGLYASEETFRADVDSCAEAFASSLGLDLRDLLFADANDDGVAEELRQTRITQPALFVVEYAVARLLQSWGIEPAAVVGHSIGEVPSGRDGRCAQPRGRHDRGRRAG